MRHVKFRKVGNIYGSFSLNRPRGGSFIDDVPLILIIEDSTKLSPITAMFTLAHEFGHFEDHMHTITSPRYNARSAPYAINEYYKSKKDAKLLPHPEDAEALYESEVVAWKYAETKLHTIGWKDWKAFKADTDVCLGTYWEIYAKCRDAQVTRTIGG